MCATCDCIHATVRAARRAAHMHAPCLWNLVRMCTPLCSRTPWAHLDCLSQLSNMAPKFPLLVRGAGFAGWPGWAGHSGWAGCVVWAGWAGPLLRLATRRADGALTDGLLSALRLRTRGSGSATHSGMYKSLQVQRLAARLSVSRRGVSVPGATPCPPIELDQVGQLLLVARQRLAPHPVLPAVGLKYGQLCT